MPKTLRWLWVVVFTFPFLNPACSIIIGRHPIESDLRIDHVALFVALFATIGIGTILLEGPLLGAAFLFFAVCVIFNAMWLGTAPSAADLPDALLRRASGAFLSLLLEVTTEPAPPGNWEIHQLGHSPLKGHLVGALQHSVYADPRTGELIANWLRRGRSASV